MTDYLSLALVIAIVAVWWWIDRHLVWRRCRCGTRYCTGCGRREQ